MPSVLLSHPTGNANSRAALNGLFDLSLLVAFHTSVALFSGNAWYMLARLPSGREFKRREYPDRFKPITWQRPFREIGRILAGKAGLTSLICRESGIFCVDAIYRDIDRAVAKRLFQIAVDGVYAYEDGSLETFRVAKNRGIKCFYDLPIGYWRTARRLLEPERDRWPEWLATLSGFKDSAEKLARKDEELHLADHVFVASSFTKQTLFDYPGKIASIHVIPYGFPAVGPPRVYSNVGKRKLKLLFVGGLSQRKGIADVFAVAETLKDDVELTIVGQGAVNECVALSNALKRHRWIPSLPHAQILELMRQHDILLFPSLFEGFGLVITEAMSQGTPVITTERTAGPDLIQHEKNGWLIAAGNTLALQLQIEAILNDRDSIAYVGEQARQSAMVRPWSVYGKELANSVMEALTAKL
jgi:glycosyltransferase involved in cell wall biosynthesis